MTQARLFLVAYDIASPKRWRKVQRSIRRLCQREQLSVFVCRCHAARIARLESELRAILHPEKDRLLVLDLGSADTAGEKLKLINPMTRMADLPSIVL
jgi:CRISPR-associated protein Cas2